MASSTRFTRHRQVPGRGDRICRHADAIEQGNGFFTPDALRILPEAEGAAGETDQRHLHVSRQRSSNECLRHLERAATTPWRQILRGGCPVISMPSSITLPLSGINCPPIMLKVVDMPAPLGPISAMRRPRSTSKVTSRARRARRRTISRGLSPARGSCRGSAAEAVLPSRAPSAARVDMPPPTSPRGMASTMAMIARPSRRRQWSVSGITKSRMAWNAAARRAKPTTVLYAAEQHHDEEINGRRDRDQRRIDGALGEGEEAARKPGAAPAHDEGASSGACARRFRWRRPAALNHVRPQRVAEGRVDRAAQYVHAAGADKEHHVVVGAVRLEAQADGHTPTTPLSATQSAPPTGSDGVGDLREGERQHREIDAREPHDEET